MKSNSKLFADDLSAFLRNDSLCLAEKYIIRQFLDAKLQRKQKYCFWGRIISPGVDQTISKIEIKNAVKILGVSLTYV